MCIQFETNFIEIKFGLNKNILELESLNEDVNLIIGGKHSVLEKENYEILSDKSNDINRIISEFKRIQDSLDKSLEILEKENK